MALAVGATLGPYQIQTRIGKGGMGEVFRARDTRLNREVAIKVSAHHFSERFEREAKAIAALNHPHICTLYDVGPDYLVMEYVAGPTLAEKLKSGAMPLEESLNIAQQMADALECAHERGIIYRDLKPTNIKVKPDGTVKVLDFGLAKQVAGRGDEATATMTEAGTILGTAAYMSPEQARGNQVDKRTDIWAFGAVLYEMLTGERAFRGESVTDILAAVVKNDPDWSKAPEKNAAPVAPVLGKRPQAATAAYHRFRVAARGLGAGGAPIQQIAVGPGCRVGSDCVDRLAAEITASGHSA